MTDHFRKKSIVFRDTRYHQKDDAKNRLPIPGPSPEKSVAEIDQLKKTDLSDLVIIHQDFERIRKHHQAVRCQQQSIWQIDMVFQQDQQFVAK